jgi:hypothetical protein
MSLQERRNLSLPPWEYKADKKDAVKEGDQPTLHNLRRVDAPVRPDFLAPFSTIVRVAQLCEVDTQATRIEYERTMTVLSNQGWSQEAIDAKIGMMDFTTTAVLIATPPRVTDVCVVVMNISTGACGRITCRPSDGLAGVCRYVLGELLWGSIDETPIVSKKERVEQTSTQPAQAESRKSTYVNHTDQARASILSLRQDIISSGGHPKTKMQEYLVQSQRTLQSEFHVYTAVDVTQDNFNKICTLMCRRTGKVYIGRGETAKEAEFNAYALAYTDVVNYP